MSPWKKTIYRFACLSLLALAGLALLQRRLVPGQFFDPLVGKAPKPEEGSSRVVAFWDAPVLAVTPTSITKEPPTWDVKTSNCSANINLSAKPWFRMLEPRFQQFVMYRHCRYFPILINHPEKCKGDLHLLIVVKSVITQHDRREAIRRTWGQERTVEEGGGGGWVRTIFLLGTASKEEERVHYQQLLNYEDRLYRDIIQWDFLDSFFNLTLKEVHFLKWQQTFCPNVRFIFKGDDDVFVSPDNLLEFLADKSPEDNLFVGDVLYRARPIRKKDNKYYIPNTLYSRPTYPPYVGGGGFLMTGSLAGRLHHACKVVELYPIDDVFLGMCLQVIQVPPTGHGGFKTFGIMRDKDSPMNREPCFFRSMLVVHKLLPTELLAMWKLVNSNLTCSQKLQVL